MGAMASWPREELPREKLSTKGADALSDAELLAVVIGVGAPGAGGSVLDMSRRLLQQFGGIAGLEAAAISELASLPGMGRAKACKVKAAFALGRRVSAVGWEKGDVFRSGADVSNRYGPLLAGLRKEVFLAIPLDAKNRRLGEVRIAEGTLSSCPVHPREVFVPLIREAAASAIFVHNHPSGDPSPSSDDIALTLRLREVGELIGIRVLDHVIVGKEGYVSLADRGFLK